MDFLGTFLVFLIFLIVVIVLLYVIHAQNLHYWQRQGVDSISLRDIFKGSKHMPCGLAINEYYPQMYAQQKAFKVIPGLFTSMLVVQDLHAIRDILITQFENFPDRGFYVNHREALSANITHLDYKLWKPLRQRMSPSFSPAKVRYMFPTLLQVAAEFVTVFRDECHQQANIVEIYDLCARFTTDFIGNVIFGIQCNSLSEPKSEFRIEGDKAFYQLRKPHLDFFAVKFSRIMQFLYPPPKDGGIFILSFRLQHIEISSSARPNLTPFYLFNIRVFDKRSNEFFIRVFRQSLEHREKNNLRRNDFMDLLIDLKKQHENDEEMPLSLEMLAGQVFAFFIGGFETTSCTMSYALYELAKNHQIQDKAREEILHVLLKNQQQFNYESLKDLTYLKAIIQKSLSLYPIVPTMPRICRRKCTIKSAVTIKPDTPVLIPIYGVQHNPDFYPHPDRFLPERFAEEENANRDPCTFLAFGGGPKICIGELLARMLITLGLAMLLSEFRFSMCERTPQELAFDPENMFILYVKDGIHLKVEILKKS
ncbi:cytochrome P450 6a8 [Stomoxys calcitrans]|uniref:cytochrome P450 6a8 n=1 Tax=Stomoxys calcitrans TaxID=35570 RepID=UPI0027E2690C|nr:cytochrome P450 6a8 [Stomoxys calcitrans]